MGRPVLFLGRMLGVCCLEPGAGNREQIWPLGRLLGLWLCMVKQEYPVSLSQGSFCHMDTGELQRCLEGSIDEIVLSFCMSWHTQPLRRRG